MLVFSVLFQAPALDAILLTLQAGLTLDEVLLTLSRQHSADRCPFWSLR
jgi:hypothetical protein